jgi:iron-sulfur cluster insertion protein
MSDQVSKENHEESQIYISDNAAKRINQLLSEEDSNIKLVLRISVEGGGCAGFQYKYEFVNDQVSEDDHVFKKNDAVVVIDSMSLELIKGSIVDYVEELGSAYFEIKNPNAKIGCGCGNSFSL